MQSATSPGIVVLGSINMDLVLRCERLPRPGETVAAEGFAEICGGKGANQAVAAARAGGRVAMIGRVGDDGYAQSLRANLKVEGIDCRRVLTTCNCSSGLAIVAVEASGENSILTVGGANTHLSALDVQQSAAMIQSADCLLLQLEIPVATALAAIQLARQAGVRVILNPAPVPKDWSDLLLEVDLVCPNQTEAQSIVGFSVDSVAAAERAAREIRRRGASRVLITLGEQGLVALDEQGFQLIPPFPAKVVDTTAAGDAFAGALAVRWAEADDLHEALRFACAAGAIAVSRMGAQPSLPTRAEILRLVRPAQRPLP